MTKRVLSVLAVLMICLPLLASDVGDKIIGTWTGSWGNRDISEVFSQKSFNMTIHDHEGDVAHSILYVCEYSGSYQMLNNDLILHPRVAEVVKDYSTVYSPKSCDHFPEFKKDKNGFADVNLHGVDLIVISGKPDEIVTDTGRMKALRE